jgi:protein-L-isoaspartate(D-aspartate) O-methyltransferase
MSELESLRWQMVDRHIAARGIRDERVLDALRTVPREAFVPADLVEFAYDDTPLPIEAERTLAQPFVVALMAAALELSPHDRVLEVDSGAGFGTAVLSRLAGEVYTIESNEIAAELVRRRCESLGYTNVYVLNADGTLGWREHAPYDAIAVAAGGPGTPDPLLAQLAIDGRLVMLIGRHPRTQELMRFTRRGYDRYERENLGPIRFVPPLGAGGWKTADRPPAALFSRTSARSGTRRLSRLVREVAAPVSDLEDLDLGPLLERIGKSRVVLLGGATNGTSEFQRMRTRITRELIVNHGFTAVAVEADWPDAAKLDRYVRNVTASPTREIAFTRFPTWMWRNREMRDFVHWLAAHNSGVSDPSRRAGFHGLDLYGLYASRDAVLRRLDEVDAEAARVARHRYGRLTPWEQDPALYPRAALPRGYALGERAVVATLRDMLRRRLECSEKSHGRSFEVDHAARVLADAERYYRLLFYGCRESWNLRSRHMFETLQSLLESRGPDSKAVVWQHNCQVGSGAHTEMGARGEQNLGMLVRERYGSDAFVVGFGTDRGTVAASSEWGGKLEIKKIRPAHPESYEGICHRSEVPAFLLHLRDPERVELREELAEPRLERAIGVVYRPEVELHSHYFQSSLSLRFDEYIWFDDTCAVTPLEPGEVRGMPESYPFRL